MSTCDTTVVKLLEQGEQHHGNHHPDGNFGKPRVIQERLQSKKN
jgi:hypothetical protein